MLQLQNPNASQWNIVCIGSLDVGSHVGHVHFIFYAYISFALGSQFAVEYGLKTMTGGLGNDVLDPRLMRVVNNIMDILDSSPINQKKKENNKIVSMDIKIIDIVPR